MDLIFKYLVLGFCETKKSFGKTDKETIRKLLEFFSAVDTAKHSSDVQEIARLVEIHHLKKDHLCTKLLKEKQVVSYYCQINMSLFIPALKKVINFI